MTYAGWMCAALMYYSTWDIWLEHVLVKFTIPNIYPWEDQQSHTEDLLLTHAVLAITITGRLEHIPLRFYSYTTLDLSLSILRWLHSHFTYRACTSLIFQFWLPQCLSNVISVCGTCRLGYIRHPTAGHIWLQASACSPWAVFIDLFSIHLPVSCVVNCSHQHHVFLKFQD